MDLPQSTPQAGAVLNHEQIDFCDISSDLPDIMTMSGNDIPDLVYISDAVWFA